LQPPKAYRSDNGGIRRALCRNKAPLDFEIAEQEVGITTATSGNGPTILVNVGGDSQGGKERLLYLECG